MDHEQSFETPEPISLEIHWHAGDIHLHAAEDARETTVRIDGPDEEVAACSVELRGSRLVISSPKPKTRIFFSRESLDLEVTVPAASSVSFEVGSSDVTGEGRWEHVQGRSGSGEIEFGDAASAKLEAGSGDITLGRVEGDAELKSGSGDIDVQSVGGGLRASSGSGDIHVAGAVGGSVQAKSGSGDITLESVEGSVRATGSSGDVHVETVGGALSAKTASGGIEAAHVQGGVQANTASGDIRIDNVGASDEVHCGTASGSVELGIPQGRKVWADVHSLTGSVYTDIERQGQAIEGETFLTLRINTVSGDVSLQQV